MNWRRWIRPGLLLTLLIAALAVMLRGGTVEDDLRSRVQARLVAQGQGWAEAEASWRGILIRGIAPTEQSQARAVEIAAEVAGVASVRDRSQLLPEQAPYHWVASRTGNLILLSGFVPSEGARAALLAEARRIFPAGEIQDELALARGAPDGFGPSVAFALERLSELAEGEVQLNDATLVVAGTALDDQALEENRRALAATLPSTLVLGPIEVLPARAARFVWSAAVGGDGVLIAGFVPNEVMREMVAEQVRGAFPGLGVEDQSIVASGEPDGYLDAVAFAITTLTRLENGGVTLDGLSLDVAGTAKSVDSFDEILTSVESLPAGMNVVAADVMPATVEDYRWYGEVDGNAVVLAGYVPTLENRQELVETARGLFGERTLRNEVKVALGGPRTDWFGGVKFALGELARLSEGTVAIGADAAYAIEGLARSSDDYAAISGRAADALPASMHLTLRNVRPPTRAPYGMFAERRGNDVRLGGYVADREQHGLILASVRQHFGAVDIVDETIFASGAPSGFSKAARSGIQALGRLVGGRLALTDTSMDLRGTAVYQAAVSAVDETISEQLPDPFQVESALVVRQPSQPLDPEACSERLKKRLAASPLEFDGSGATLAAHSHGVLDRIAALVQRCPETVLEIGVHSDSDGSRSANRRRTQERADAVVDYLVTAEIRRERLRGVGHGEDDPVASNDSAAGKAANRRIEFALAVVEPPPKVVLQPPEPPAPPPGESDGEEPQPGGAEADPPATGVPAGEGAGSDTSDGGGEGTPESDNPEAAPQSPDSGEVPTPPGDGDAAQDGEE